MKLIPTTIEDCLQAVEVPRHFDSRGFFQELFNQDTYRQQPFYTEYVWRQVNWSENKKDALRGIHVAPYAKLINCLKGEIFDVVVDMRPTSPTYMKWYSATLTAEVPSFILIPPNCGHGFLATEDATVIYLQSDTYGPNKECTVRWDDPAVGIDWPVLHPILSAKDANAPYIKTKSAN